MGEKREESWSQPTVVTGIEPRSVKLGRLNKRFGCAASSFVDARTADEPLERPADAANLRRLNERFGCEAFAFVEPEPDGSVPASSAKVPQKHRARPSPRMDRVCPQCGRVPCRATQPRCIGTCHPCQTSLGGLGPTQPCCCFGRPRESARHHPGHAIVAAAEHGNSQCFEAAMRDRNAAALDHDAPHG